MILDRLKQVLIGEKNGGHFIRTALKERGGLYCASRGDSNAESLASLLIIDGDKHVDSNGEEQDGAPNPYEVSKSLKAAGLGHILFGSYSYYCGLTRYRIILVSKTPYLKTQLEPTAEAIVAMININLSGDLMAYASENGVWSQPWYYPRKPADSIIDPLYIEYLEGNAVEVIEPSSIAPVTHSIARKISISSGEISPIQAFNEQNSLTELLSFYGYKRVLVLKDHERWLSPDSTSGQAGIIVKDNKFFSYHGSDPFNDSLPHDAFDLMRVREGVSEKEAIIKAAMKTRAPDGRTIDEHNKSLVSISNPAEIITDRQFDISFDEYRPFRDELLPVEPVPYEALPEQMAAFIKEQSEIRGCPADFILVSVLARMGLLFAGKVKIAMTRNCEWNASPNFFWVMVGEPTSGKSNALNATCEPIQKFEVKARDIYQKELMEYKAKIDILNRQLKAIKKGMDKENEKPTLDVTKLANLTGRANTTQQEINDLRDEKPAQKEYTIAKISIERLILILVENPAGILIELDEFAMLLVRLSKDENCAERGLILSAYNGNTPYSYKILSRDDVHIPNLVISIVGGLQPSKLKRFINEAKEGIQDDGLLQRLQGVVYPDKKLLLPLDKKGEEALRVELNNIFEALDSISSGDQTILRFDDEGQNVFDEWREETTKIAHELKYPLNAHVGKSYEFVASLSVYLFLYKNNGRLPANNKIPTIFVLQAIKLGSYFLSHAKRMYSLAYKEEMPARSLAEKLVQLGVSFTRSQIRNKDWSNLKTAEQRVEAIQTLINRGYISEQTEDKRYITNPKHLDE